MNVKAVIFDIGGVLLRLGEREYRRDVARQLGLDALPASYEAAIPALQRGERAEEAVWAEVAGRPVPTDAFDAAWLKHFRPVPAMLALAADLRHIGFRTAILSNTQPSHVRIMRRMGFLGDFEPVVMSCEAGSRKPETESFHYVLSRLELPATAVAYVDDLREYVEAAQRLGIHAVRHQGDATATRKAIAALLEQAHTSTAGA